MHIMSCNPLFYLNAISILSKCNHLFLYYLLPSTSPSLNHSSPPYKPTIKPPLHCLPLTTNNYPLFLSYFFHLQTSLTHSLLFKPHSLTHFFTKNVFLTKTCKAHKTKTEDWRSRLAQQYTPYPGNFNHTPPFQRNNPYTDNFHHTPPFQQNNPYTDHFHHTPPFQQQTPYPSNVHHTTQIEDPWFKAQGSGQSFSYVNFLQQQLAGASSSAVPEFNTQQYGTDPTEEEGRPEEEHRPRNRRSKRVIKPKGCGTGGHLGH